MAEYILREQAIIAVTGAKLPDVSASGLPIANGKRSVTDCVRRLKDIPAADVRPVPEGGIGEMSDGYHTFNGLYYQRMILFAALVKAYKDKAWKSHRHEDGELCFGGGWFIVGIDTPQGSYTYHYDDTVWDFFDCEELPTAKHWDGHTEKDVTRLLSLPEKAKWINLTPPKYMEDGNSIFWMCSECRSAACFVAEDLPYSYCPNCGADMRPEPPKEERYGV